MGQGFMLTVFLRHRGFSRRYELRRSTSGDRLFSFSSPLLSSHLSCPHFQSRPISISSTIGLSSTHPRRAILALYNASRLQPPLHAAQLCLHLSIHSRTRRASALQSLVQGTLTLFDSLSFDRDSTSLIKYYTTRSDFRCLNTFGACCCTISGRAAY